MRITSDIEKEWKCNDYDEGINYDRSFLGRSFRSGTFEISREMILEFSQASGEVNPIYVDEARASESEYGSIIAPATFCNLFVNGGEKPDHQAGVRGYRVLRGAGYREHCADTSGGYGLRLLRGLKEVYAKTGRSGDDGVRGVGDEVRQPGRETVALVDESYVRRE